MLHGCLAVPVFSQLVLSQLGLSQLGSSQLVSSQLVLSSAGVQQCWCFAVPVFSQLVVSSAGGQQFWCLASWCLALLVFRSLVFSQLVVSSAVAVVGDISRSTLASDGRLQCTKCIGKLKPKCVHNNNNNNNINNSISILCTYMVRTTSQPGPWIVFCSGKVSYIRCCSLQRPWDQPSETYLIYFPLFLQIQPFFTAIPLIVSKLRRYSPRST